MPFAAVLPFWFDRPALEAMEIAAHAEQFGYPELWVGEMCTFDAFALSAVIAIAKVDDVRTRLAAFRSAGATVAIVPSTSHDPGAKHLLQTLAEC